MVDMSLIMGGERPHKHSAASVGRLLEQVLVHHPRAGQATQAEAQALVDLLATNHSDVRYYQFGGKPAGRVGGPGTWIDMMPDHVHSAGQQCTWHTSPFVEDMFPVNAPVPDPTVLERVAQELVEAQAAITEPGQTPIPIPRLLRAERDTSSGYDIIVYEASGGEDRFTGWYSHIVLSGKRSITSPKQKAVITETLARMRLHHEQGNAIADGIAHNVTRARTRFEAIGAQIGETLLVSIELDDHGKVSSVATTTAIHTLGDTLSPRPVMLTLRHPPRVDKGEIDGWRVHARDHRRRSAILAGRKPLEAITVCPVLASTIRDLAPDQRRRVRIALEAVAAGTQEGADPDVGDAIRGVSIRDGRITASVAMTKGTWRGRTLQVPGVSPPDTMLLALSGRPMSTVLDEPKVADMIIERASNDGKGRLNVVVEEQPGTPYRDVVATSRED